MRLTILGGGGFRVPLVYRALLGADGPVHEVVLHDLDRGRLEAITRVLAGLAGNVAGAPQVRATTELDEALAGADFVFSAIRVGGLEGRTADERVALDLGLLGQETTGPGGIAYGLRTVPAARHIAERCAVLCPRAWVINFTNPAGMITEAMQGVLGERVIGICDSPIGLGRRAAVALGLDPARTGLDYAGLNHLGWLRGLRHDGRDVLPELLAEPGLLAGIEEGELFGPEWVHDLGCLPNEYLYYYYRTREAIAAIKGGAATRGEFLLRQQAAFYEAVAEAPETALAAWERTRRERDATYMAESREGERAAADVEGGGYERVALELMSAITRDEHASMLLNVRNGSTLPELPEDAVIEVGCAVDANGARPLATAPLSGHQLGLVAQVKECERHTITAAVTHSRRAALSAFALHPLVDSVDTARILLEHYRARIPGVAAALS
ncbi:6-phospho-beta-glucosidase [Sciscionella sediminilitoris]|uniref:6-phospho-beta-glucosidase n=1 Tax=Sciscionella sediminilitoris TaxID=1445613 RepID=UPI0004DFB541|nr:6-phospho-beta-glucosidase [Sciscionella sp. SE31]